RKGGKRKNEKMGTVYIFTYFSVIADRTTRRVLSRFTPGALSRSNLLIIKLEVGWLQTLGAV
ncbi:MAG: hypothetical protein ACUVV5_10840, partial [Candidatus Aminicenantales bacterium]